MSYCRFSSMNWMCDVYVYADVSGGWITHVASRRWVMPPVPDIGFGGRSIRVYQWATAAPASAWRGFVWAALARLEAFWHNRVHLASLRLIPLRRIDLTHAGETFTDPTPAACADRLEHLQALGYRIPQWVIGALREESEETHAATA